jgi:hypothetical protein
VRAARVQRVAQHARGHPRREDDDRACPRRAAARAARESPRCRTTRRHARRRQADAGNRLRRSDAGREDRQRRGPARGSGAPNSTAFADTNTRGRNRRDARCARASGVESSGGSTTIAGHTSAVRTECGELLRQRRPPGARVA